METVGWRSSCQPITLFRQTREFRKRSVTNELDFMLNGPREALFEPPISRGVDLNESRRQSIAFGANVLTSKIESESEIKDKRGPCLRAPLERLYLSKSSL